MFPAAVDFQKPFTSTKEAASCKQTSATSQNPNPSNHFHFSTVEAASSQIHPVAAAKWSFDNRSGDCFDPGLSSASSAPRINPKKPGISLASNRSRLRSLKSGRGLGFHLPKSDSSFFVSNDSKENGSSTNDVKFGNVSDVAFVFGASKENWSSHRNSNCKEYSGSAGQSTQINSKSMSNLNFKNQVDGSVREMGMNGESDSRNVGFVFGANKFSESRNVNMEHNKSNGGGLQMNANESFQKSKSVFGTGRSTLDERVYFNDGDSGVKSKNSNSSLDSEFGMRLQNDKIKVDAGEKLELRTSYANEKKLHKQEINTSENWGYVFGDGKSSRSQGSKQSQCSGSEVKSESCELDAGPNLHLHQCGFGINIKNGVQSSKFGSAFTDESSAVPKSTLGHNSHINNINKPNHSSGNCTGSSQAYAVNLDPHIGNGHGFVFGSSSLYNLSHDMKKLSVDDVQKAGSCPSSSSTSEPFVSVSTKPFIFQASYSKGSDGSQFQMQNDSKLEQTTRSSISKEGHNPGSSCSRGVKNNDQSNFTSLLSGLTSSIDFGKPNPNGSSTFNLNYCPGLDKTRGNAKFRSDKGRGYKKNRKGFMQADPVHNNVSNQGSQSPNSYPCGSPMDYSPYRSDNCASFSENTMNPMHAKSEEKVVNDNITSDDSNAKIKEGECQEQFYFLGKSFMFSAPCTELGGPARKIRTRRKNGLRGYSGKQHSTPIHTINMTSSSVQFSPSTFTSTVSKHSKDADLATAVDANIKKNEQECHKTYEEVPRHHSSILSETTSVQDPFIGSETESIKSDPFITKTDVNPDITNEKDKHRRQHSFTSSVQDFDKQKNAFSVFTDDNFGSQNPRVLKKYRAKVGNSAKYKGIGQPSVSSMDDTGEKCILFPPAVAQDNPASMKPQAQKKDGAKDSRGGSSTRIEESVHVRKGPDAEIQAACEKWRIRGNQAYGAGHMSRAEEFYTNGINSVPPSKARGYCCELLVLCYSNRAATRMSLNRLREALEDCKIATEFDPHFLKAQIRAANCHLALGEVKDAMKLFESCLESGKNVCLDRRLIIDAANGLQKAQKVLEWTDSSAELLRPRYPNSAVSAFEMISQALSVSAHSEKLLKMKGEALFMLRRYEEVVQLCESTIDFAGRNFTAIHSKDDSENMDDVIIWRWILISKCHFHMGKLELALDVLEQNGLLRCSKDSGISESVNPLVATLHELLHRKNAGNEAFQSGRLGEAVELYSAAISSSMESRPFAAICFCNRAAAYQALNQIIDAIADCSLAMALDGNYLKAVSRRATLHEMIRDYGQATNDLRKVVSFLELQLKDKTNQSSASGETINRRKELRQAHRRLVSLELKAKKGISLDHYLILGVKESDTSSEIKKAYHKAALKHHPDKAGQFLARTERGDDAKLWKEITNEVQTDADRLFKVVGEAYAVLSDSQKRTEYDHSEQLRKSKHESNDLGSSRNDFCSSPQYRKSPDWQRWQEATYRKPHTRW
ncbi:uncharacterized protein LOC124921546 [Impatiens glandulifera]|uniref:uncharacterized protein LOC124921546 n=1 Tax=Impatiens glandulifera TaxID=253017 RepID=UPI001FB0CCF5|nr:uncharacterized protein LOC124921546 [Impatiens glandulifera]